MKIWINILLVISLVLFLSSCKKKSETEKSEEQTITEDTNNDIEDISANREEISNPSVPSPTIFKNIAEAKGDLDGDEIQELAVVYETQTKDELGHQRELHIFKKKAGNWELLHKSVGPILSSLAGGMMADPFENITMENGAIVIHHFGGSREKWMYTHRFRFQNEDWYLIGATIEYSIVCEETSLYDYNVSTGKVNFQHTKEACDNDGNQKGKSKESKSNYSLKAKQLIKMDGFVPGNTETKLSKDKTFYF